MIASIIWSKVDPYLANHLGQQQVSWLEKEREIEGTYRRDHSKSFSKIPKRLLLFNLDSLTGDQSSKVVSVFRFIPLSSRSGV
jgi:hypothetical protein